MIEKELKTFETPDKNHLLKFILDGELRFGPQYFKIAIDTNLLENRIFAFTHRFSLDSRYIALQEWDTIQLVTSYLFLVDLKYKKGARISEATDAFILPKDFKDGNIIYEKDYRTDGRIIEYQIKIDSIKNWEKLKKSWVSGLLS